MTSRNIFTIIAVVACIAIIIAVLAYSFSSTSFDGAYTEYECDVKNFELSTAIEISKDGTEIAKVEGDIFHFVTDPLTMYDTSGNKIAYAGDAYHFIAQDSHAIYVDGQDLVEMVGLIEFFGESYEIYDKDENLIATADFNSFNTSGEIYDANNNLIAEYSSNFFFNDFTVRISEDCSLDHNIILMIICSYYSDQYADSSSS